MNKRNIERALRSKHRDFLLSITDDKVRGLINNNSIITGGALTLLLLKEKPKDFDYYFTDKETVLAIARYFVDKFNQSKEATQNYKLKPPVVLEDGDRVRIRIQSAGIASEGTDESEYQFFESRPEEESEDYITQAMHDIIEDADEINGEKLEEVDGEPKQKYRPIFLSDNAITLSDGIQLVIRFYGQPKEIHDCFDFVHCMNYWVSKTRKVTLRLPAIESILTRELKYIGSKYPVCSFVRMRKFLRKGWWINAGQILKICLQISELDLSDVSVLEEQLTGVDTAYFFDMIRKLKEKYSEEDAIDMPYVVSIIDKLFG